MRGELAAVEARIRACDLSAMLRRGLVEDKQLETICDLLEEQAATTTSFGEATDALREALRPT